jgi:hypothetical protein
LGTIFVLYCNSALHTHIPNIAVFAHQDHSTKVAPSKLPEVSVRADVTRLETSMSFLQIKSSMSLHEIWQVKHKICQSRWEIACGANIITKSGVVAYVAQCNPVEVLQQLQGEDPMTWNNTGLFVDPIGYLYD